MKKRNNRRVIINIVVILLLAIAEIMLVKRFIDTIGILAAVIILCYAIPTTALLVFIASEWIKFKISPEEFEDDDDEVDDVERIMAALKSDNLVKLHEGPLTTDRISVNLEITSVKKHQSDIDIEEVEEDE